MCARRSLLVSVSGMAEESSSSSNPVWLYPEIVKQNLPERWGHSGVYSRGKLYIYGGCRGGFQFGDVLELDLKTMTWRKLNTSGQQPGARDSHSAVLYDQKMIVFGGTNGAKKTNDVHILDLKSLVWTQPCIEGSAPAPRESHTATMINRTQALIFGGSGDGGNYLNDIHILDCEKMKWISPNVRGNRPASRDSHSAVVFDNRLVVYGGDCGDRYLGDLDVLELESFTWSKLHTAFSAAKPGVRAGHIAIAVDTKMYVFGGVGDRAYYNDLWVLDVESGMWSELDANNLQPQGRFSHVAALADDGILVYGGCGEDEKPLDEFLVLYFGTKQTKQGILSALENKYHLRRLQNGDRAKSGRTRRLWNGKATVPVDNLVTRHLLRKEVLSTKTTAPWNLNCTTGGAALRKASPEVNYYVKRRKTADTRERSENDESSHSEAEQERNLPVKSSVLSGSVRGTQAPPSVKIEDPVPELQLQLHIPSHHHHLESRVESDNLNGASRLAFTGKEVVKVGSELLGFVDGVFDSGYLMTAHLNGHVWRGILFNPGHPGSKPVAMPDPNHHAALGLKPLLTPPLAIPKPVILQHASPGAPGMWDARFAPQEQHLGSNSAAALAIKPPKSEEEAEKSTTSSEMAGLDEVTLSLRAPGGDL